MLARIGIKAKLGLAQAFTIGADFIGSSHSALVRVRMQPGFHVSIDREVRDDATGRVFLRTVRGGYIRAERLVDTKRPEGIGVALGFFSPSSVATAIVVGVDVAVSVAAGKGIVGGIGVADAVASPSSTTATACVGGGAGGRICNSSATENKRASSTVATTPTVITTLLRQSLAGCHCFCTTLPRRCDRY